MNCAFVAGFNTGLFNSMFNPFGNSFCTPMFGFNPFYTFSFMPPIFSVPTFNPFCFNRYNDINPFPQMDFKIDFSNINFSNIFTPNFQTAPIDFNFNNSYIAGFDTFERQSTYTKTGKTSETAVTSNPDTTKYIKNDDSAFDKMLTFVLSKEGGYTPNDCGEAGNKGIRQSTYNTYRNNKGLSTADVKNITNNEVREIYYNMYYKASGADKIENTQLAFYVFDTAVNMGTGAAKELLNESGNNPAKFNKLRTERYKKIAAKDSEKARFLNGWLNRVSATETFTKTDLCA